MSDKRFERWNDHSCKVKDNQEDTFLNWEDVVNKLNALAEENEELKRKLDYCEHEHFLDSLGSSNKWFGMGF